MQQDVRLADQVADELRKQLCGIVLDVLNQVHPLAVFEQTVDTNLHPIMKPGLAKLRWRLKKLPSRFF